MPKSEDGQYELVLENRQVLVIFLFAAVLCGVFFGLGFIVGQSSKGSQAAAKQDAAAGSAEKSDKKKSALSPAEPPSTAAEPGAVATPPATEAKGGASSTEKPKPEEKAAQPVPVTAPPASVPAAIVQSTSQFNLQVAAFSTHEEAEPMAALLKRKNFPVSVVAGQSDKLQHVLVGPYPSAKDAEVAKKKLEDEGFKPIVKK